MLVNRYQCPFGEQAVLALNPAAWFMASRGVTVTGSGVSQWDDQSGNARHLKQGTDANRPSKVNATGSVAVGSGSSFTRATVATVTDFEGCCRNVLSGEVRFQNARRVRNLLTAPEGGTASWSIYTDAGAVTVTAGYPDPLGGNTALFVKHNGVGSPTNIQMRQVASNLAGKTLRASSWIKVPAGFAATQFTLGIFEDNAPFTQYTTEVDLKTQLSETWQRFCTGLAPVTLNTATRLLNFRLVGTPAQLAAGFYIWHPQSEDVTGQSNQNPSEYVSVGVLSSPYHGCMVDGVKYFDTQNGNTVASNVVTEATGAPVEGYVSGSRTNGRPRYLPEGASTNLVLQSSNFGTTWTAVGTPTRSAAAKYCGDIALDLIGDDSAAALEGYTQTVTFTADASKSFSFLVAQGTSTSTAVRLRDTTAGANRALGVITWSGGAPVYTATTGSQERAPEPMGNGVWRIYALATGVVAANTNSLEFYPATDAALAVGSTGTIYVGGVQAENAIFASSHVPTTTGTVTRNKDVMADTNGNAVWGDGAAFKLATDAFTRDQPRTIYALMEQTQGWASAAYLTSGTVAEAGITQVTSRPTIGLNAGSAAASNAHAAADARVVVCAVINGASSSLTVNNTTETTGNAGANNPGGITLFSNQAGTGYFQGTCLEYIDFPTAHDATQRALIIQGLAARNGIAL